jgi:hypothetical protein
VLDDAERGEVAPLEVVERDEHGARPGRGLEEVDDGAEQMIAEEDRVLARGVELDARTRREGRADELGEKLDDTRASLRGDGRGEARELLLASGGRLAAAHVGGARDHRSDQCIRRSGADRLRRRGPRERVGLAGQETVDGLRDEARLAEAGRGDDRRDARARLLDALVGGRGERGELGVAPDAGDVVAEHGPERPGPPPRVARQRRETARARRGRRLEASLQEARGHLVDDDLVRPGAAKQRRRAGEHVARRSILGDDAATGRDDDARALELGAEASRRVRGPRGPIGRRVVAVKREHLRTIEEDVQDRPGLGHPRGARGRRDRAAEIDLRLAWPRDDDADHPLLGAGQAARRRGPGGDAAVERTEPLERGGDLGGVGRPLVR